MTTKARLLTLMVALSAGACGGGFGCGVGVEREEPPAASREASPTPDVQIDPSVQPTATEFARRLAQYDGRLLALSSTADTLNARWMSGKCDYFESEVIDLLISVHRTSKASPTIAGQRECNGNSRTFTITGSRLEQYRTGKINDAQILADVK